MGVTQAKKEHKMETKNKSLKADFSTLLISGVILLTVSQALEGTPSPTIDFLRGVCVGLSLVASLTGLYLYARK
jgi:hypothetical protein